MHYIFKYIGTTENLLAFQYTHIYKRRVCNRSDLQNTQVCENANFFYQPLYKSSVLSLQPTIYYSVYLCDSICFYNHLVLLFNAYTTNNFTD